MRLLFITAALCGLSSAAAAEENWIAQCLGADAQYTQTVGGAGFFHVTIDGHTYDTQKLVQVFFNGKMVCAVPDPKAPRANSDIALVCADNAAKKINVLYQSEAEGRTIRPSDALPYCSARIDVLKN